MTRRLRPPAPLWVSCRADGQPVRLRYGGRERAITHVAATWVRPAAWWVTFEADAHGASLSPYQTNALNEERTYFRVVLDGVLVYEIFSTPSENWYLERIID